MPKPRGDVEYQSLAIWDRPRGINTTVQPGLLGLNDAQTAQNFHIIPVGGRFLYATRPGLTKVTSTATESASAIKHIKQVPISGTNTLLLTDAAHKLYKPTGTSPNLTMGSAVKTLAGETQIVPFSGDAILLDGSYIKTYNGTTVSLAYDDGDGSTGYMYNNTCCTLADAAKTDLYSGGTEKIGAFWTTPAWDSGYTIPVTVIDVWLSKTGSPTGSLYVKIYSISGTLLGTSDAFDVETLTTSAKLRQVTFTTQYGVSTATPYILGFEYSSGDASNYVSVHGDTDGANMLTWDGTFWTQSAGGVTDGSDVLLYGGMDDQTMVDQWTELNSAVATSVAGGKSGNAMQIAEGGAGNNTRVRLGVASTGGTLYHFEGYVKAGTEATYKVIHDGVTYVGNTEESAGDWSTKFEFFHVGSGGGQNLNLYNVAGTGTGNTILYDSVTAKPCTPDYGIAFGVKPGRPPQGYCGDVKDARLYVGSDGRLYYSNVNTSLDWSTASGGGYVSAVDDDANSFPIGAVAAFYGDVYIIGKQAQPYLSKLTGTGPDDYTLPPLFQEVYTDPKQVAVAANDVYLVSGKNAYRLSGVQEYGDIRAGAIGDSIKTTIASGWSTSGFSVYNPVDGEFWYCPGGGSTTVYVIHVKYPIVEQSGVMYPVTTYVFKSLTPTAFGVVDGVVHVGMSNGHLYKLDTSVYADAATAYDAELRTGVIVTPFGSTRTRELNVPMKSSAAATCTASFYRNGSGTAAFTKALSRSAGASQYWLDTAFDALEIKLNTFSFTSTVYLGGLLLKVRKFGRRGA